MKILELINKWIEKAETTLMILIVCIMVLLAFLQVLLRNLFDEGILWGDIFLRHLVLWVGFIGASLATRQQKHINIDLFTRLLPGKWKEFSRLITNLFAVFICYLLANAGWKFVQDEIEYKTIIFNDVPAWYFQIIIPIGFLLMSFRFLILSLDNIAHILNKKPEK